MNSWPADQHQQYNMMPQMMGMPNPMMPTNQMAPMPTGPPIPMTNMNTPSDWNQMMNAPNNPVNFIGPIPPEISKIGNQSESKGFSNKNGSDSRRDKDRRGRSPDRRDRDRGDQRSRSDRRGRQSKWSDNQQTMPNNIMMNNMPQGNMMQYPNNLMDMSMSNMVPMGVMPMPIMSNMMDQNQMMAQIQMQMGQQSQPVGQQPIYISNGVLLPPVPGTSIPARREKPPGCRTIFIGGLPSITKDIIIEIFQRFGDIIDVKLHRQGVCHVRFERQEIVEQSFFISGYRYKLHDQTENEATTLFIDYALNREDQEEYDKNKRRREPTPPKIEPFTPANLTTITDKIKSDIDFHDAAPTLAGWLERGECTKKNANTSQTHCNTFYSLIQASNSQIRRLYNEKMQIDEEYQNLKTSLRDKFASVIAQFEQVAKILSVAKHQRVSDHFSKQQRRNIELWLKMTEDLENMREEFNTMFDEDDTEVADTKNMIPLKKYEELKSENENLMFELEGYRNEAHLAKDEAERKFEKFKAQYIAQQALQNNTPLGQMFPPLPPPPIPNIPLLPHEKTRSSPDLKPSISQIEAKLISVLTAYLLAQPLGSTLENLVGYVKSIIPHATQAAVHNVLRKYGDLFKEQGASSRWVFVTFDIIKKEKL